MYIINAVYSEGMYNGREVFCMCSLDKETVIKEAYKVYSEDFEDAEMSGQIEESCMTYETFHKNMEHGFEDNDTFVLIAGRDYHIQFEPTLA